MVIVEAKDGLKEKTSFEFQYVPDHMKITVAEDGEKPILSRGGTELRSLKTLCFSCIFIGAGLFAIFKVLAWTLRAVI